jgi:hypothetical protein
MFYRIAWLYLYMLDIFAQTRCITHVFNVCTFSVILCEL